MTIDIEGYCRRIRLLRRIYKMNQTQFADFLELPYKKWNHYERGYLIPRETALVMRKKISGLSTDWLWEGDTRGLSPSLYSKVLEAEREEARERRLHKPARHRSKP